MYCQTIIFSTLLILTNFFQLAFGQSGVVIIPESGCTWRGADYGEYTGCSYNEVAIGSCGSGKDPDCLNTEFDIDNPESQYDMLYCCELEGYGYNSCEKYYASYGVPLSCFGSGDTNALQTSILEAICGSGKDDDCENYDGDSYSHMIECCNGFFGSDNTELYSAGSCYWQFSGYGVLNICNGADEAVFGRCGSGRDPDCETLTEDNAYVGIQCCRLLRL